MRKETKLPQPVDTCIRAIYAGDADSCSAALPIGSANLIDFESLWLQTEVVFDFLLSH
jgi:hypothetical protein